MNLKDILALMPSDPERALKEFQRADWKSLRMNGAEALDLLKGGDAGIRKWNTWRTSIEMLEAMYMREQSGSGNTCSYAIPTLHRVDLAGFNLAGLELDGVNLAGIDFRRANLRDANFSYLDLTGTRFDGADLQRARFFNSNLKSGSLRDALLSGAHFSGTNLGWTDFSGAKCWDTVFANVDLSAAQHLDEVVHAGPSEISLSTLVLSEVEL